MKEFPILPSSLTELKMLSTCRFESFSSPSPLHNYFPNTIVKLVLQYSGELFIGLIPTSVTDLKLHYSKPIPKGAIPNSVKKFHLVNMSKVKPIVIPNSVTYLTFEFDIQLYPELEIPDSAKTLKIKFLEFNNTPFLNYLKTPLKNITRFSTHEYMDNRKKGSLEAIAKAASNIATDAATTGAGPIPEDDEEKEEENGVECSDSDEEEERK
ncbi:hypothetical protein CYY_010439 [Polysphondylium violaceum]|uniref:Uncharacterized protein n=1 Tax=Polysphondylium violaceum TaxID=133409 RepID=A0A8J4UNP7_9MYCE|nr:hypothetical protein CYY_010439 [Polysphondylium violaceum]